MTPPDRAPVLPGTPGKTGAELLPLTLLLALLAWGVMLLQEIALFARPTPYGGPYVDHWDRYFFHAALFNLLGVMLVAAPVLVVWAAGYRHRFGERFARRLHAVLLLLLALTIALDQADNEVMRFMGTHLTLTLLRTYGKVGAWGSDIWSTLTSDRGGPGVPFLLLVGGPALLWWTGRRIGRHHFGARAGRLVLIVAILALALPLLAYRHPRGRFRRARVQPEILTLAQELGARTREGRAPADLDGLTRRYREAWLAGDAARAWRFDADSAWPLLRSPLAAGAAAGETRWNVIYLQLETFRGWDMGFLRPDRSVSPTPFLDRLAADSATASWTRALSFGPPTVTGFMAGHCSIPPHSRHEIATTFTLTRLDCLPVLLRRHGWRTAYFTGADPDWDSQSVWLRRWYDEHYFYRDANEVDREVFHRAAERIRELGRSGTPFLATVISLNNHYPFRTREPALALNQSTEPREAVLNTVRYTDDVVREFLGGFAGEPWFARTLVVILGDHGYGLGEHGVASQRSGWRESLWIPLLIHGAHPRLPRGSHGGVASMLDVAPTLADLLGVRETTAWQGHSLLDAGADRVVSSLRSDMGFAESDSFSLVLDPVSGEVRLFGARQDPLQQRDVAAQHPDVVDILTRRATEAQALLDYLLEVNRIWPFDSTGRRPGKP